MLKIDPEFQNKIPPLTQAEFEQLEENILADGEVYEPIVTWNGVIVDGHNRWKIIQQHPEIPYKTREMDFSDKWAAFEWMYKKQLGRRNLTEENRWYCIGKMYEARKQTQGGTGANQYTVEGRQIGQFVQSATRKEIKAGTAGKIGAEVGIDGRSVRRYEKFAKGVDAIREVDAELADKILAGRADVSGPEVRSLAKANPEQVKEAVQEIKEGKRTKYFLPHDIKNQNYGGEDLEPQIPSDPNWKPEYTVADMLEEMGGIISTFVKQLSRVIEENKALVAEGRDAVAGAIDRVVTEMTKLKEDL